MRAWRWLREAWAGVRDGWRTVQKERAVHRSHPRRDSDPDAFFAESRDPNDNLQP